MRLNLRKLTLICGGLVLLLLVVSYSSILQVPTSIYSKNNVVELEKKIDRLKQKMDDQLLDSAKLLESVREHLKKAEEEPKESKLQDIEAPQSGTSPILPVLLIACDRVTVKRCLDNLVKFRPSKEIFPIIVSQDCGHNATYKVIKSFVDADPSIAVVRQPDLSEIPLPRVTVKYRGYYKIARHYRFALNHVFKTLGHEAVIIVEDDLDISPDFFEYFLGTYQLLLKDPSIWCISAWNDNGKKDLIDLGKPELLHRTDFFPGLGWMFRQETWLELEPHWPQAFFDDWLRNPENTKSRSCIRPEISRTYSFGKVGVSNGLYFDKHLRYMQLNMDFVEFTKLDLSYLIKDTYDQNLSSLVAALPQLSAEQALGGGGRAARVPYADAKTYQKAAKRLGLMDDFRSGIPRTAYNGIVSCQIRGRRVYLAPSYTWTRYDPTWG